MACMTEAWRSSSSGGGGFDACITIWGGRPSRRDDAASAVVSRAARMMTETGQQHVDLPKAANFCRVRTDPRGSHLRFT